MPIYEYQCPECHTIFEEWQNISAAKDLVACPECGVMSSRIISNTAFVLKGSGWYVTEYGNRKTSSDTSTLKSSESTIKAAQSKAQSDVVPSVSKTDSGTSQSANA